MRLTPQTYRELMRARTPAEIGEYYGRKDVHSMPWLNFDTAEQWVEFMTAWQCAWRKLACEGVSRYAPLPQIMAAHAAQPPAKLTVAVAGGRLSGQARQLAMPA